MEDSKNDKDDAGDIEAQNDNIIDSERREQLIKKWKIAAGVSLMIAFVSIYWVYDQIFHSSIKCIYVWINIFH